MANLKLLQWLYNEVAEKINKNGGKINEIS